MPRLLGKLLIKGLAAWLIRHPNAHKHRIQVNLELLMPELPPRKRSGWIHANIGFLAGLFFEMPRLLLRERNRVVSRITQIQGKELALKACKHGKGVIFLLPHLGNWEVLAPYLGKEFRCTALFKPLDNAQLNRILWKYRTETGMKLVPISRSGIRELLLALKRKECAVILPDQTPRSHRARQTVRFFGTPMPMPSLLTQLHSRTGAQVISVFAVKSAPNDYRVEFHSPAQSIYAKDIQQSVQGVAASVEKCVRLYPTQYQWSYRILNETEHREEYRFSRE